VQSDFTLIFPIGTQHVLEARGSCKRSLIAGDLTFMPITFLCKRPIVAEKDDAELLDNGARRLSSIAGAGCCCKLLVFAFASVEILLCTLRFKSRDAL
jgi:hypothetical protein